MPQIMWSNKKIRRTYIITIIFYYIQLKYSINNDLFAKKNTSTVVITNLFPFFSNFQQGWFINKILSNGHNNKMWRVESFKLSSSSPHIPFQSLMPLNHLLESHFLYMILEKLKTRSNQKNMYIGPKIHLSTIKNDKVYWRNNGY